MMMDVHIEKDDSGTAVEELSQLADSDGNPSTIASQNLNLTEVTSIASMVYKRKRQRLMTIDQMEMDDSGTSFDELGDLGDTFDNSSTSQKLNITEDSVVTPELTEDLTAAEAPESRDLTTDLLERPQSTILPVVLFKAAVLKRHHLLDVPHKTSRDADVIVLQNLASVCSRWKAALSESGDLRRRRLKRLFHNNPQLLLTLNRPPTDSTGYPREVRGLAMLDNYLYVIYELHDKVEVFDCEDRCKKIKDIQVKEMESPGDMVGSSVTSQLLISNECSDVIWRVDLRTGISDVFVKAGDTYPRLSLVENRLLVTSVDSLLMFDILSGERMKEIPFTEDIERYVDHAIEFNRDSYFVSHGPLGDHTLSEIDSEGRVIRVLDNEQELYCVHLALDSADRLLVADLNNTQIVLLNQHLEYERILIDDKRLDNAGLRRMIYHKNNSRLTVGFDNGQVKMFELL